MGFEGMPAAAPADEEKPQEGGGENNAMQFTPEQLIAAGLRTPAEQQKLEAESAARKAARKDNVVDFQAAKAKRDEKPAARIDGKLPGSENPAGMYEALTPAQIEKFKQEQENAQKLNERFEGGKAGMISPEDLIAAGLRTKEEQENLEEARKKAKEVAARTTKKTPKKIAPSVSASSSAFISENPAGMHKAISPEDIAAHKKKLEDAKPKKKGLMSRFKGLFGKK